MLGKLFSYELRALWKPALIMLAVMVVAGLAGTACLGGALAASDAALYGAAFTLSSYTRNGLFYAPLFLLLGAAGHRWSKRASLVGALFCGFLVWAAVAALYVFVAMRFYRTMFTDEGYLTLTLPVRTGTLVLAKFWAAYLLLAVFALGATMLYALMVATISGGDADAVSGVLSITGGWFAFVADGDVASVALGVVNTLVTCAYALGLAFGSLTLGAWWARRHKVAAAVGIYLGVGWLLSLVFSIAGVLAMTGDVASWDFALAAVSVAQLLLNAAVAAGALALSALLVRTKVDLN